MRVIPVDTSAATLLITKPGPNSILEGVCMGLPMLLDCSMGCLPWERTNVHFVTSHGYGDVITDLDLLLEQVHEQLARPLPRREANVEQMPVLDFQRNIRRLVDRMLTN